MQPKLKYRFHLRCKFDHIEFFWPPEDEEPIEATSMGEALNSRAIVCPGDIDRLLAPHAELFADGRVLESRDIIDILSYTEEAEE